jgi:hypothetical protein
VADFTAGLRVLDVSNPKKIREVGKLAMSRRAVDVAVADGYGYVADAQDGVYVVDLRRPFRPEVVALVATATGEVDLNLSVLVRGGSLLVAGERLWSVAVDDPFHPSVETDTLLPWSACGVAVDEPRAFVAGRAAGLAILQRSECLTTLEELNRTADAGAQWGELSAEHAGAQRPQLVPGP